MPLTQLRQDPVAPECEPLTPKNRVSLGSTLSGYLHRWLARSLPIVASLQGKDKELPSAPKDISLLAVNYVKALGGFGNLQSMSATRTHLLVELESDEPVDYGSLQKLGVMDHEWQEEHKLSLFIGPLSQLLNEKIQGLATRQGLDLQPRAFQLAPFTLS